jgi:putative sterol carrier protein
MKQRCLSDLCFLFYNLPKTEVDMAGIFPEKEWVDSFVERLNTSEDYARIAKNWEGDIIFEIQAEGALKEDVKFYLDLWHGSCREGRMVGADEEIEAAYVLKSGYSNFSRIVLGELDPMQALLTRKLAVTGNLGYMLRQVPTVLQFVKCAQEVTDKVLGQE